MIWLFFLGNSLDKASGIAVEESGASSSGGPQATSQTAYPSSSIVWALVKEFNLSSHTRDPV